MLPAEGLDAGVIAGIGTGGVVFLVLIVVLVVLVVILLKRFKDKTKRKNAATRTEEDTNPVYGLYECDADNF